MDLNQLNSLATRLQKLSEDIDWSSGELIAELRIRKRIEGLFVDHKGHLTEAGLAVIARGWQIGTPQADIARLLGVTRGTVSQQTQKLSRMNGKKQRRNRS